MQSPPDILASIAARGSFARKDIVAIMVRWLERQLIADQYARLGQAGHSPERKILLSRVFIDVEAEGPYRGPEPRPGIVAELLATEPTAVAPPPREEGRGRKGCNHFLIVGGPGQGKSTAGQFLCQLHRAALLSARSAELSPEGLQAMTGLLQQGAAVGLEARAPLFPVRVELSRLANWLSEQQQPATLLSYLTAQVLKATGEVLDPEDLRAWLQLHPLLLVLDGLDEVPVSAGRAAMLQVIQSFRAQLGDSLGLLVAATRPQGYGDELADFQLRRLAPLSEDHALRYGERLVQSWFPQSEDERERVLERLQLAVRNPATAHLMRSPLQVTIMASLLHKMGTPPKERWHLFERYYNVIYDREQDKPGAAPELAEHRRFIDAIHRRVGLLLQVESERSGNTNALLTLPRLREIIDTTLSAQKIRTGRAALTERLLRLATDRLVFLVEPQDGRFGFEVRSLQEFMAAEALRDGADEEVRQRLLQIGRSALWRNVLSFVLSHAMHTLSHWRMWICDDLCQKLNESPGDEASQRVLVGTQLAIDFLAEGGALRDSVCAELLVKHALQLLDGPISKHHELLAHLAVWEQEECAPLLRNALEHGLRRPMSLAALGAWAVLIELANQGIDWATQLAEKRWPAEGPLQQIVAEATQHSGPSRGYRFGPNQGPWLLAKMAAAPHIFKPSDWGYYLRSARRNFGRGREDDSWAGLPAWLLAVRSIRSSEEKALAFIKDLSGATIQDIQATYRSVRAGTDAWRVLSNEAQLPPHWQPWVMTGRLLAQVDESALAQVLRLCSTLDAEELDEFHAIAPWPVAQCLNAALERDELSFNPDVLKRLAAEAAAGRLGNMDDWLTAEQRWNEQGISAADWQATAQLDGHLDASIHKIGIPGGLHITRTLANPMRPWEEPRNIPVPSYFALVSVLETLPSGRVADNLRKLLSRLTVKASSLDEQQAEALRRLLESLHMAPWTWPTGLLMNPKTEEDRLALIDSFDQAGRQELHYALQGVSADIVRALVEEYQTQPHRVGILHLLAFDADESDEAEYIDWKLPEELLSSKSVQSLQERLSIAALRLRQGLPISLDIANDLADSEGHWWLHLLLSRLNASPPKFREDFYLTLLKHLPASSFHWRVDTLKHLLDLVRARPTGLDLPQVWDALKLPPPRPQPPKDFSAPVQVRALTIRNLRCFDELSIDLPQRAAGVGGWTVLIGENGVGKTTALRAVALACLDPAMATAVLAQMREQSRVPMLRRSTMPGEVLLQLRDGRLRVHLRSAEDHENVVQVEDGHLRPLLYAYGCQRGSALGGPDRDLTLGPLADVNTLFEGREGLIHGETWLKNRKLAALQQPGGRAQQIYDTICAVLLQLLPGVTSVDVRDDRSWVTGPAVGEAPLGALSDGYISTAGWVLDLLARYLERARQRGWSITADFPTRMEGLVLVDEVDQHMHPRWQARILADLRRIFPRLSFIVTTHNPMTLLGAEDGEVVVMRRSENGRIEAQQIDIPRGLRVDQVLTGSWFGLASTLHPAVLDDLDRHQRMLRDGVPADHPARLDLEERLRQQLGSFAETSYERLAQSVAAQVVDERFREQRPEERQSIHQSLRDLLRQRVEERGGKLP